MVLEDVGPGRSRVSMVVRPDMANGLGVCHGGFIFILADSAMAFASNAYGDQVVTQHAGVTLIRPGKPGETLTAVAEEKSRTGRSGIYDARVTGSSDGTVVAEFRGHTRQTGRRFFTSET